MEMLQLKYFFESAKSESFTHTAEKYMVPTTSVSASVKRLEKELGCTLFDRYSNRICLNSNGKLLLQSLHKIFSELDLVTEELSSSTTDTREIRILARALRNDITENIINFRKKYPNVVFKLVLDFNPQNIDAYDIIIDEKCDRYPEYESFELCRIPLRLMADSKNIFCGKKLRLRNLQNQPFVSWSEESNMHKILMNTCMRAGFVPDICITTNDMKCHERLIESGIGIGVVREDTSLAGKGTAKILDVTDFDPIYTVCCYYKRYSAYGNIKTFLNFIKNEQNK